MHELRRSKKKARHQSRDRWNLDGLDAALESVGVAPCLERPDKAILIETEDGVQRMTVREMFDSFERDAVNFEALKVGVG